MIYADIHENDDVIRLIRQSVEVNVMNLNSGMGLADFAWLNHGEWEQIENKSWTELLWGMDRCENQLRKWMMKGGRLSLVIRGLAVPQQDGVVTYRINKDGNAIRQRLFKVPYGKVSAWLWSLDNIGIGSFQVANERALALWLVACYQNSAKTEHTILQRLTRDRRIWIPNPHVANLSALHGANIGPVRAQALVNRFRTTWEVLSASINELCEVKGIGQATARRIWESIGRKR